MRRGRLTEYEEVAYGPAGMGLKARSIRALLGELGIFRTHPRQGLMQLAALTLPPVGFDHTRTALLRAGGLKIGEGALVRGPLVVTGPGSWALFEIGARSRVSGPLRVDLAGEIRIGNDVHLGCGVTLLTMDHRIGPGYERCGQRETGPIVIEDGCWIGANVTILPGVTLGAGSVVAVGAVVTHDVPPDTLVSGVPARVTRELRSELPY